MPIIQNYSDKHNPRIVIFSALYVVLAAIILVGIFKLLIRPVDNSKNENVATSNNICFEPDVEQYIVDKVDQWTLENEDYKTVEESTVTDCRVLIKRNTDDPNSLIKLFDTTYVLAIGELETEETTPANITQAQLIDALVTQSFGDFTLIWNLKTDSFLRSNFNIGVGQIILSDEEINKRLQEETGYIAVRDIKNVEDAGKIIPIDQQIPEAESFNSAKYPLIDRYWIGGSNQDDIDTIYGILVEQSDSEQ